MSNQTEHNPFLAAVKAVFSEPIYLRAASLHRTAGEAMSRAYIGSFVRGRIDAEIEPVRVELRKGTR